MKNTKKIFNNKIHIIFAIFTLILSFGINFINVSAFSTAGELSLSSDEFNSILIDYPYYIKTYNARRTNDGGVIEQTQYYFSKSPLKFIKKEDGHTYLISDDGSSYRNYSAQNRYDKNGGIDEEYPSYTWSFRITSDYKELYISDSKIFKERLVHSNFVFEGVQLSPEDFPTPPAIAETLGEVNLIPEMIIIVGSMICLVACLIGLRLLLKGLRTVSRG